MRKILLTATLILICTGAEARIVGGVNSLATACPDVSAAGGDIVLNGKYPMRTVSLSSDAITAADCGKVIEYMQPANVTMPALALTDRGWHVRVSNASNNNLSFAGPFLPAGPIVVPAGGGAEFMFDGTNFIDP